jgi:hypothetical protein
LDVVLTTPPRKNFCYENLTWYVRRTRFFKNCRAREEEEEEEEEEEIKEDRIGGVCNTHGRHEKLIQNFNRKSS